MIIKLSYLEETFQRPKKHFNPELKLFSAGRRLRHEVVAERRPHRRRPRRQEPRLLVSADGHVRVAARRQPHHQVGQHQVRLVKQAGRNFLNSQCYENLL